MSTADVISGVVTTALAIEPEAAVIEEAVEGLATSFMKLQAVKVIVGLMKRFFTAQAVADVVAALRPHLTQDAVNDARAVADIEESVKLTGLP